MVNRLLRREGENNARDRARLLRNDNYPVSSDISFR